MIGVTVAPDINQIAGLLSGIVGHKVTAVKSPPMNLALKTPKTYGLYRDSGTGAACLCILDMPFCAYTGGAMLAFPLCAIQDALKTGSLEEGMLDSVREIMNICARMFRTGHQVFQDIYTDAKALPEDGALALRAQAWRVDLKATVDNYGAGQMTVMAAKPNA